MPANIIEFVDVTVNTQGVSAEKFSFGTLLGVFDHSVTANRQDGPYFSLAEVNGAGFTSIAAPEVNAWATSCFSQENGVDQILIGREDAGDANWTATMDAIEAAGSDTWYITNIESRVDADILEVAAWTEARDKIYIAQSDSADFLAGNPANIGEQLEQAGYNRTALIYHATSTGTDGYLDGAWSSRGGGFNLDVPGGVGTWFGKQLSGVTFDAVTGAQANNIYDVNGNLFGRNLGLSFTSKGTMASGAPRFIDVTTSIDWTKKRIEEAVLALFVGTATKIPYTNAGINQVASVVQGVLNSGVTFGHFSSDTPPTVTSPDVNTVSDELKQNRELQLEATALLAGAIQKLTLTVNLSF